MRLAAAAHPEVEGHIATLLKAGIVAASDNAPLAHLPKPVRLKKRRLIAIDDVETAIASGRE